METQKNSILRQIHLEKDNEPLVWSIVSGRKLTLEDDAIYSIS